MLQAAIASSKSSSLSQPRLRTHNSRSNAIWLGGPPKPMQPIRPHSRSSVPSCTRGGAATLCNSVFTSGRRHVNDWCSVPRGLPVVLGVAGGRSGFVCRARRPYAGTRGRSRRGIQSRRPGRRCSSGSCGGDRETGQTSRTRSQRLMTQSNPVGEVLAEMCRVVPADVDPVLEHHADSVRVQLFGVATCAVSLDDAAAALQHERLGDLRACAVPRTQKQNTGRSQSRAVVV